MPSIRLPISEDRQWRGTYKGDYTGDVKRTYNIDLFTNQGRIRMSPRYKKIFSNDTTFTANDTNFLRVETFLRAQADDDTSDTGARYWAVVWTDTAGDGTDTTVFNLYHSGVVGENDTGFDTGWAADERTAFTTAQNLIINDIVRFEPVSASQNSDRIIASHNTGSGGIRDFDTLRTWNNISNPSSWDTDVFHPAHVFEGEALFGNANEVVTYNTDSTVVENRVQAPDNYVIHHIFSTPGRVWYLMNGPGQTGAIAEWNGFSRFFTSFTELQNIPMTGVDYFGSPVIVSSNGDFLEFTGEGFQPIRNGNGDILSFPLSTEGNESLVLTNEQTKGIDPFFFSVPRRGIAVDEGKIVMNVGPVRRGTDPYFHMSGVWVFDPRKGQLYQSRSFGDGSTNDFGNSKIEKPGAILKDPIGGIKLASAQITTDAVNDSTEYAMYRFRKSGDTSDTSLQRGFLQTQQVHLNIPEATFESVWVKHNKITDTNARILLKARAGDNIKVADQSTDDEAFLDATWTADTAFTVLNSDSSDSIIVGDEVEIVAGPNAGRTAHITSITGSHGDTQTLSLDETLSSDSSGSLVRIDRWKKLQLTNQDSSITADSDGPDYVHSFAIPGDIKNSPDVSLKLELRGRRDDVEVDELILNYETSKQAKI